MIITNQRLCCYIVAVGGGNFSYIITDQIDVNNLYILLSTFSLHSSEISQTSPHRIPFSIALLSLLIKVNWPLPKTVCVLFLGV